MAGMEIFGWGTFALVAIIGIYELIRYKKNPIPFHPLTKYILIFAVTLIISIVFSPYLSTSEKSMWHYLGRTRPALLFIFNLIVLERFVSYKDTVKWMSWFLLPMVLLTTFMAVSSYNPIKHTRAFHWDWSFTKGIIGFFVTYIEYANIYELYFFIILAFALLYNGFKKRYKIWLVATALITLLHLLLSGSRVVFLSIPFALFVQAMISKNKKIFIYVLLVFIVTSIATYSVSPFVRAKAKFTISDINKFGDHRRYDLWRSHFALFRDNPITGVGFEMAVQEKIQKEYFQKIGIAGQDYETNYKHGTKKAHNMFLYMMSGSGIIGLIAFLSLLIAYAVYSWKTYKVVMLSQDSYDKVFVVGLIGASATILSNMIFDTNIDSVRIAYSVVLIVSLMAHLGLKYSITTVFKKHP
jgi:O-antigen ligase